MNNDKIETTNKTNKSDTYGELAWNGVGILLMTILTTVAVFFCYFHFTGESVEKIKPVILMLVIAVLVLTIVYFLVLRIFRFFAVDRPIKKLKGINEKLRAGEYTAKMNIKGLCKGTSIGEAMEEFNILGDALEKETRSEIDYMREIASSTNEENLKEKLHEICLLAAIKEDRLSGDKKAFSLSEIVTTNIKNQDETFKAKEIKVDTDVDEKISITGKEKITNLLIEEIVGQYAEKTKEGSMSFALAKQKPNVVIRCTTTEPRTSFPKDWKVVNMAVKELNGQVEFTQEEFETFLTITIPLK